MSTIVFPVATLIHFGVPKISGKINQHERNICARLKTFREGIQWSQSDFAEQIGITKDQLASIEYGRTPLRYDIAWKIRRTFGLSIDWLWGGGFSPDDLQEDKNLPLPDATGLPEYALLSEVVAKAYNFDPKLEIEGKKLRRRALNLGDIDHRAFIQMYLEMQCDLKLPRVPEGYVKDFAEKVNQTMDTYLKALPPESEEIVWARHDALFWKKMRRDIARRTSTKDSEQESALDVSSELRNNTSVMKLTLSALLDEVQKLTSERGMKARLASELGVPPPRVNEWLSRKYEPSGEVTLRLLHWVEQQKRKK